MLSLTSSVYEENETEPPDLLSHSGAITRIQDRKLGVTVNSPFGEKTLRFKEQFYPNVSMKEWSSWQWQLSRSITSWQQLSNFIKLSDRELMSAEMKKKLPMRITPYYASLIDPEDPLQPIRRTMVPVYDELLISPEEKPDPLGEETQSPVPQLVHRYPDRVLFLATGVCAAYCRYCTRSHMVSNNDKVHSSFTSWDVALDYIREHTEIRDVLLSGGDPLTMSDNRLEYLLSRLRQIPHVEIIRIGSKVPVVLPQRITSGLVRMLKKYHPLFMSIHFTHPDEITPEVAFACNRLADAGLPLGSQTVLLKGVNDDPEVYRQLAHKLLKIRVRPYYLYQCDQIPGSAHFRTPVAKGLEIIKALRGFTSGYAIPHFVIDAPDGGGKIPLLPNYLAERNEKGYLLRNYEGKYYLYPEAQEPV
ncbi:MAG: KamA family radical SAM protein [Bacteroidales bacterium]|nr:KamA family radical SAM protein [Bacteroidales bacterium]